MIQLLLHCLQSVTLLLSYISSGNAFPKPLSSKEEALCLEQFQKGDMEARNKLIEHNLRLVAHISKKYTATVHDSEDLLSIGTIGLIKGISSFDPKKGARLATYAARCIENEILMMLRAKKKEQGDVSLNEAIGKDKEGNQIMLIDVMQNEDMEVFDKINAGIEVQQLYRNIQSELDPREKKVILLRYGLIDGHPLPQRVIAKKLGISRSYVSRIEKKAVSKLKKGLIEKAK